MTLKQLLDVLAANPIYVIFYFSIILITAVLAGLFGKGEGHLSPWRELYATLIYLVCIPGLFAISLFFFGKQSLLNLNVVTQVLPIAAMVLTLVVIKNNVRLEHIPSFGKLSGLIMMISAVLLIMWLVDKMRIVAFTHLRFEFVILIFIAMLILIRIGWSKIVT